MVAASSKNFYQPTRFENDFYLQAALILAGGFQKREDSIGYGR